ncbi:MAG: hypothetical protein LBR31_00565 [Desulfovibrio sp.]|jgi:hypothetical protein|nr:hypothetical protein [Desulfovibrio sp.]
MIRLIALETLCLALLCWPASAVADVAAPGAGPVRDCREGRGDGIAAPGRIFWARTEANCRNFSTPWRFRESTYELHFDDSRSLARASYALALHARDIDLSLPVETYLKGLLGFHYSTVQVCDWLNDVIAGRSSDPALDEAVLAGLLLEDRVIAFSKGRFVPTGRVRHILAASAGKKRTLDATLRHERLHVFWDEDEAFRKRMQAEWRALPEERRAAEKKALSRYAGDNEAQLLEEWAVKQAERSNMDLR